MKDRLPTGTIAPDFTFDTPWKQSLTFYDFLKDEKALLIFHRYMGCLLCQMKLAQIAKDANRFKDAGCNVFIVLQSEPEIAGEGKDGQDIPITIICDPDMNIYKLYKVYPGTLFGYIKPDVIKKAMQAKKQGYTHGKSEGKEFQLPAVFFINTDKVITYAYYGKNIGDVPDNESLLSIIRK